MKKTLFLLLLTLSAGAAAFGQDLILDRPVRAGELTLFQSLKNKTEYFYLSDKPRLATDPQGRPQFTFLRYVENLRSAPGEADITEGEGGGIVHAVIELSVSQAQLDEARRALQRINPSGKIIGPALYDGGTIALISSVSDPQSGFSKKVLGVGKAPILDGQKAAVSIQLTKLGAKVLWESFKSPTPDMSFSFEMELKGYKSPKGAIIEANFDQLYQSENFSAAAITRQGGVILAGEINSTFERMTRSGAIKVTSFDPDADIEKAIEDAYSKLTRMMFEPAGGSGTPAAPALPGSNAPSMLDRAQALLNEGRRDAMEDFMFLESQEAAAQPANGNPPAPGGNPANPPTPNPPGGEDGNIPSMHGGAERPEPTPGYVAPRERYGYQRPRPTLPTTAIVVGYTMRTVRQTGTYRIDLNKYTADNISLRFDQNVGSINCAECFREINLDDPLFKQREISAILDGYNADDFQKYINFVSVSFQKKHANGEISTDEVRIDRTKFNQQGSFFKLMYGWKDDVNRLRWREYEYKTVWNFFGGATVEFPYIKSDLNAIPLSPPYVRKVVDVEMDADVAAEKGIRSAEVKVTFAVEGKEMVKQIRLNPKSGQLTAQVEVLQPASWYQKESTYSYQVTWMLNDGSTKSSAIKTGNALVIYADQI